MIVRYRSKISGPLMDKIDINIAVPAVKYREISSEEPAEGSDSIRRRGGWVDRGPGAATGASASAQALLQRPTLAETDQEVLHA